MITIVTTAINRPEILSDTMMTLTGNSNVLDGEVQWLVNVDFVRWGDDPEGTFDETIALCESYADRMNVRVFAQREGGGPSRALSRLREHVEAPVVLFLEDDWWCHPNLETDKRLDVDEFVERLGTFHYATATGQENIPSFNPCFIRTENFRRVTEGLDPNVDAESQVQLTWQSFQQRAPDDWKIDPRSPRYFKDLGRTWIKGTALTKWNRPMRFATSVTYGVEALDPDAPEVEAWEAPEYLPIDDG